MKWVHASICEVYGREGLVEGDFGRLLLEGGSSYEGIGAARPTLLLAALVDPEVGNPPGWQQCHYHRRL